MSTSEQPKGFSRRKDLEFNQAGSIVSELNRRNKARGTDLKYSAHGGFQPNPERPGEFVMGPANLQREVIGPNTAVPKKERQQTEEPSQAEQESPAIPLIIPSERVMRQRRRQSYFSL